jgi:hypothetical protein
MTEQTILAASLIPASAGSGRRDQTQPQEKQVHRQVPMTSVEKT